VPTRPDVLRGLQWGSEEERQRRFNNFQKQHLETIQAAQAYQRPVSEFPVPSPPPQYQGATHVQRREASSGSGSVIATTRTMVLEPALVPQIDPHPNSPELPSIPTTLDSPPALARTLNTTGESGYSKYSGGMGPSPPQQPDPYFQSHRRQHDDENSGALAALTFLNHDEAHTVRDPPSPPHPQKDSCLVYDTPSDSEDDASQDSDSPTRKLKSPFTPLGQGSAKLQAQQDDWVERSNSRPVDTAATSVSENGTHSTPPLPSYVEC
jgi:hypothetical protein